MSARLARFLYRFRIPLTALTVAGALVLSPRAEFTRIDNDLSAWFPRPTPSIATTTASATSSPARAR